MNKCYSCLNPITAPGDCFTMSYLPPDFGLGARRTTETLFFHPECFISMAGVEFAHLLGMSPGRIQTDLETLKEQAQRKEIEELKKERDIYMKKLYRDKSKVREELEDFDYRDIWK